ncbi:PREDICTED: zinc finger BED domain-containing protein RICESLEEPER 2-like [Brassica oleracea var. oleracea]|uniref:zinc finger BED domain-containing protein RICESLEEPER 2-like n=1 Tax=Brassica oleracea var. oleracea TaxID=109376 RepID=UPI0006A6A57D|nr:PREDICTED: zinc finger BED domain-containing protein RICESLEEPER 2-like [Brassica oleracea var. oleracea]XP_013598957.1 PREDICTED: zinc finger BED domain-containing protein RICESLEEPER 2-like [Brassica oleracea var. oleracea]XP_013598958.1 PREDICTED: zinc finger BED domain-containing protein RICESLEEPER 2-like [Brassica oleracea var. oleracea]XP_013598959.1 PREDICTED: zinc finger BED domain-containing protein RICESLEEPER 2-like [Brassica oleracea var. oleracea]XP_013598960.1 PREDICTED: zinc 
MGSNMSVITKVGDKGKKRAGPPQYADWKAIERLGRFLVIFYNSTLVVSASTSLNAHKCYEEIVNIATNLLALSESTDHELKDKAEEMFKKFDKYWDGLKNINKMLIVATVFDPTKKIVLASLCFDELYGKDSLEGKAIYDSVISVLRSSFKEYGAKYGKEAGGKSDEAKTSNSGSTPCSRELSMIGTDLHDDGLGYKQIGRRYKEMLNEIGVKDNRDELDIYLKEGVENPDMMAGVEYDVISFWKRNCTKFPILSRIAKDVLAMQVSSVASESAFSTGGRIISPSRSCLTHFMIEVLMCTEQWLKQDISCESRVLTNAEIIEDIEEQEKIKREFAI